MDKYMILLSQIKGIKDSGKVHLNNIMHVTFYAKKFNFHELAYITEKMIPVYVNILKKKEHLREDIPSAWTSELEEKFGKGREGYRR